MNIFDDVFNRELDELARQGVQLRHVGRLDGIRHSFVQKIKKGIEQTKDNNRLILNIAFNYGGRDELIHVIKEISAAGLTPEEITMEVVEEFLFT